MKRFWKFWDVFGWLLGPFFIGAILASIFEYFIQDEFSRGIIIGFTILFTYIWAKRPNGKFGSQREDR